MGNCRSIGRQPISGLTPISWYSFIVSCVCFSLSSLYFSCRAFMRGCSSCIDLDDLICFDVRGHVNSLMATVKKMIASPQLPNVVLKNVRDCSISPTKPDHMV